MGITGKVRKWIPVRTAEALALSLGLDSRDVFVNVISTTTDIYPAKFNLRNTFHLLTTEPTDAVKWSGKANKKSGTFAGRLTLPSPATKTAISGVLLQDQSFGIRVGSGLVFMQS